MRRRRKLNLVVPLLTLALAQSAVAALPDDWPNRPNAARKGGFAVLLLPTADPKAFETEWAKPTPGVHLKGTNRTRRGQPITTYITFKGCRADRAGRCDVSVNYSVSGPSGGVIARKHIDLWDHAQAPAPDRIQLGRQSFEVGIDGDTTVGVYQVRAAVTDRVARVTLRVRQEITVTP